MSNLKVRVHHTATDFLEYAEHTLQQHGRTSNIIYPFAVQAKAVELPGAATNNNAWQFWITQWSHDHTGSSESLDFVLAVQDNALGGYPLFIWSPHVISTMPSDFLSRRVPELIKNLLRVGSDHPHPNRPLAMRIFSVFGQEDVVEMFAEQWSHKTGKVRREEPYYEATFSFCTAETLSNVSSSIPGHVIRLATDDDVDQCAQLCKEFADDSPPFSLSLRQAHRQAKEMIARRQLWVYEVSGIVSSIVASTRRTNNEVASINKVFTHKGHRKQGYAERLVHHVTNALLSGTEGSSMHHAVVLYVGRENRAKYIYGKLGYQGLEKGAHRPGEVEDWLEIGFDGTIPGHW